ncbi:MAG: hypothetical protein JWQ40_3468 [Segetibacter sp.]|nr:hypothetical protein [Segetibacter sp.]
MNHRCYAQFNFLFLIEQGVAVNPGPRRTVALRSSFVLLSRFLKGHGRSRIGSTFYEFELIVALLVRLLAGSELMEA